MSIKIPLDKIRLEGMRFYGTHGVLPAENKLGQRFYVDAELCLNTKHAAREDDLQQSVNYADVYEVIKEEVEQKQVALIETLAENIATALLGEFNINQVWIKVTKPHPPIKDFQGTVSVEITRDKDGE